MNKITKFILCLIYKRLLSYASNKLNSGFMSYQGIIIRIENAKNDAMRGIDDINNALKSFKMIKRDILALKSAQDMDKSK